jgi:hypothetical protein
MVQWAELMSLCHRRRKRVVDGDGVHDWYDEGRQKKKKTTLIEGLDWVLAFMEIFAGCTFYFGSLLGVPFALACEARGKLLIYLLKLG